MKKRRFLFMLFIVVLGGCTADDNNTPIPEESDLPSNSSLLGEWTKKANYPGFQTEDPFSFTIGDRAYVGGANGATEFWEYDKSKDKWERKAEIGVVRNNRVSFSIGNKGYAGLGRGFGAIAYEFYEYDPVADRWSLLDNPLFVDDPSSFPLGFSIGNKGYVINGNTGDLGTEMHEYNAANDSWRKKANFPIAYLDGGVAFSVGNKGYVGTGAGPGTGSPLTNQFWQYDPATDEWKRLGDFGGAKRWLAVGFSIGNKGYIGTGSSDRATLCDFWEYNPGKDEWVEKASFKGGVRHSAVGFSIGNKGYLGLGSHNVPNIPFQRNDFWEFDPNK